VDQSGKNRQGDSSWSGSHQSCREVHSGNGGLKISEADPDGPGTVEDIPASGITLVALPYVSKQGFTGPTTQSLILAILGAVAEMERSLISERATAGRKRAKELGVKFGPKYKMSVQQLKHMSELKARGDSPRAIASVMGISRSSVYRNLRRT